MDNHLDFAVVGAQKAGTTTLHNWLTQDARIALPTRKETHFFSSSERRSRGWDWYWSCFPQGDHELRGEVDPNYLSSRAARQGLRTAFGPDLKIIVIARDPIDRARSQFAMSVRRGLETRTFEQALKAEISAQLGAGPDWCDYVWRSLYGLHLDAWMTAFNHVHVVKYEDLFDPSEGPVHYERLLTFIGLSAPRRPPDMRLVANGRAASRSQLVSRVIWDKSYAPGARRVAKALVPSGRLRYRLGRAVDRWNREKPSEQLPGGSIALATDRLQKDAKLFVERTGLCVSDWTLRP